MWFCYSIYNTYAYVHTDTHTNLMCSKSKLSKGKEY